jgi:putative endopeptidase
MRLSPMYRGAGAIALTLSFIVSSLGQSYDVARMDSTVAACDNFYKYSNGGWLMKTEIPAAFPSWGTWDILITHNRELSRDILETAMKAKAPKGSSTQLVGDYYASCMDEAAIEAAGTKPLEPYFKEINSVKDIASLRNAIAKLHLAGSGPLFGFFSYLDEQNSSMNIANVYQGGLSLPNSDYYTKTDEKSVELRNKLVAHIARMMGLVGEDAATAKAHAESVMAFEMRLAKASKSPVELRDPANYYHKMTVAEADKLMPGFDWSAYAKRMGAPQFTTINVGQPDFFKKAGKMMTDVPMSEWQTYLRWVAVNNFSPRMTKALEKADFDFYSTTLNGTTEQLPRWRRCTRNTDNALGEALGEEFVKTNFTPEAKKRMDELIDNLFAVYRERMLKNDWMTEDTRKQALAKLSAIRRKIGYPTKLRGYAGLSIDRKSYFDNVSAVNEFGSRRDFKDIGNPPDKDRWGTTATVVNAYYNSNYNDITFPAGILQPPFFDFKADDALNYGAIGIVIGHELTHGFDDSGSRYDGQGNLKMWWTPDDRKKFDEKANCVTTQFSSYQVEPGLNINGELTLGENLADLGGMAIAYDAFQKSMEGKPRPANIDGFTPEQRFFLGWSRVWAENDRPEYARLIVQSDPHSLSEFRVNGPLSNFQPFATAFACKVGDKMVREKRCQVW